MIGLLDLMEEARCSVKSKKDWHHSIFLTGREARKEVYFASESPENQWLLAAMEGEWRKWEEHKATLPLTQGELRMLKSRFPNLKIVGTRWF